MGAELLYLMCFACAVNWVILMLLISASSSHFYNNVGDNCINCYISITLFVVIRPWFFVEMMVVPDNTR